MKAILGTEGKSSALQRIKLLNKELQDAQERVSQLGKTIGHLAKGHLPPGTIIEYAVEGASNRQGVILHNTYSGNDFIKERGSEVRAFITGTVPGGDWAVVPLEQVMRVIDIDSGEAHDNPDVRDFAQKIKAVERSIGNGIPTSTRKSKRA